MSALWATDELPGHTWDPEPDEDDNGPWCRDLRRYGLTAHQLSTMTDVPLTGSYL